MKFHINAERVHVEPDSASGYIIPWAVMRQITEDITRPMPSFYKPGPSLTGRHRISPRRRLELRIDDLRERVGFWIAGYTPSDDY